MQPVVVIPSYESARTIADSMLSLRDQELAPSRLVVMDDASTDGTVEVAYATAGALPFPVDIRVNQRRLGLIGNWNAALATVDTEWFKLLCADDIVHPQALRLQVEAVEEGVGLVCGRRRVVDPGGFPLLTPRGFRPGRYVGREAVRRCARAGRNLIGEPAATLIDTELLRRAGGFSPGPDYTVDLRAWSSLLASRDLISIHAVVADFRLGRSQRSVQVRDDQTASMKLWLRQLRDDGRIGSTAERIGSMRARARTFARSIVYAGLPGSSEPPHGLRRQVHD